MIERPELLVEQPRGMRQRRQHVGHGDVPRHAQLVGAEMVEHRMMIRRVAGEVPRIIARARLDEPHVRFAARPILVADGLEPARPQGNAVRFVEPEIPLLAPAVFRGLQEHPVGARRPRLLGQVERGEQKIAHLKRGLHLLRQLGRNDGRTRRHDQRLALDHAQFRNPIQEQPEPINIRRTEGQHTHKLPARRELHLGRGVLQLLPELVPLAEDGFDAGLPGLHRPH